MSADGSHYVVVLTYPDGSRIDSVWRDHLTFRTERAAINWGEKETRSLGTGSRFETWHWNPHENTYE